MTRDVDLHGGCLERTRSDRPCCLIKSSLLLAADEDDDEDEDEEEEDESVLIKWCVQPSFSFSGDSHQGSVRTFLAFLCFAPLSDNVRSIITAGFLKGRERIRTWRGKH